MKTVESKKFIPFAAPLLGPEEIDEVVQSLKSGWITTGPKVRDFEKDFADFVNAPYAAATFSCTSALHLSLVAMGIGPGDEVITTPFTFASSALVIIWCGAAPVFVDVDPETFQIDVSQIESRVTKRTKAILPVHYGGSSAPIHEILELAERHNLRVIEDAAHAAGTEVDGQRIGTFGDATCFSFYATKNLTTAEGGMVTSRNEEMIQKIKKLSLYGISDAREIWKRYAPRGNWFYDVEMIGYKCNMTDLNASLGLHQLRKLEATNHLREAYARLYSGGLAGLGCDFMAVPPRVKSSWHLFPLLLPADVDRDRFIEYLTCSQIGTSVLFRPLHLHTAFRKLLKTKEGDFPVSERIYERLVCLPISPSLNEADIQTVIRVVREGIEKRLWKQVS